MRPFVELEDVDFAYGPVPVLERINLRARVVLCGLISQYNADRPTRGPANLDYLSEGMIDLFQNAIDGVGGYRVISPVATRLRARQSGRP